MQQLWTVNWQRMARQQVPLLRGNLDGRSNRCAGPGVRGGADVVEGMMLFRDEETGMYIPLDVLAMKLAPLLAQTVPAPADVAEPQPDWTTAPEWAQWWAMDENGTACWYDEKPYCGIFNWKHTNHCAHDWDSCTPNGCRDWSKSLTQRPITQPIDARLLAVDKKREVAERALADAQQANAQLTAALAEMRERWVTVCAAAAQVEIERDEARRVATKHAERWEAIPWAALGLAMHPDASYYESRAGWDWLNANRPTAQAQD